MANWFDSFSQNLLGDYRGRQVAPSDPTQMDRLALLRQEREAELARMMGMSEKVRREQFIAEALANRRSSAGGILTQSTPDSAAARSILQQYGDRQDQVSTNRLNGMEKDEERISRFVRESYERATEQEKLDYTRKWNEEDRSYTRAWNQDERSYTRAWNEDGRQYDRQFKEEDRDYTRSWNQDGRTYERQRNAVQDERAATKFGWEQEDRQTPGSVGLLNDRPVFQSQRDKKFRFADGSEVPEAEYGSIKGMILDDGKARYQQGQEYVDPQTGYKYTKTFDPRTGMAVLKDMQGQTVTDRSVEGRLQPDNTSAPIYQSESGFGRQHGKTASDAIVTLGKQAQAAEQSLGSLSRVEDALRTQSTGALTGSETLRDLGSAVEQLTGRSLSNFDPNNQQVAQQAIRELLMQERRKLAGQGTITDQEAAALETTLPSLGNNPKANEQIIAILKRSAERQVAKRNAWIEANRNGVPGSAYHEWSATYDMSQGSRQQPITGGGGGGGGGSTTQQQQQAPDQSRLREQGEQVRQDYAAGKISREEARQRLEALKQQGWRP